MFYVSLIPNKCTKHEQKKKNSEVSSRGELGRIVGLVIGARYY